MGYQLKNKVRLSEIAKNLYLDFKGVDVLIEGVSPISTCKSGDISFTNNLIEGLCNIALVVPNDSLIPKYGMCGYLFSDNPRLDFIRILSYLQSSIGFSTYEFSSEIHPTVKLGKNVVIEDGCYIAENVIIEHNVVIHSGTIIGKNSRIRSCSSIGGDGFGFERLANGEPLRFPHLGAVIIGDNVEVGSCTTLARGTLSNTVIEDFVKIDNLVHIAHNCLIKKGAFIIACAEISGGVTIGENAWIAPNSCTHQKISIGDNSVVGLGAVVTKNVDADVTVAGNPARPLIKR
ncbi:UDP-3-O-(3-hydroxymyristoyl)glucosamine N-acyltransferase [Psychrobacter sp. M9-54-1]|uniref:UDP-3-O-(3-hydroxymyristoyl)glucosamine N-acyltransferase n=1 Tax=Psychrobacter sp. M9-54-1 TaxID=2782386 RepID=UPI00190A850D|nr:UDP-3-O-(3-hydroxymyristoyl)glucosamine N-acyltransferase [Psychrobacter sp. M9-54-1]MBK3394400.1 UDP-3-O-(3-hydroxymyristoyl)glucosamine N-acyltransferase [Psychrobacter sp. M9-54-1]